MWQQVTAKNTLDWRLEFERLGELLSRAKFYRKFIYENIYFSPPEGLLIPMVKSVKVQSKRWNNLNDAFIYTTRTIR